MSTEFGFGHRLVVRFRDCDAMGHVNHAVYFTYLEQCRLTCWRELTGAPSPHARVIIARAECDYRAPAHFGDELDIRMRVGDVGRSSFALLYKIVNVVNGRTHAEGKTVMVSYDYQA
jgi:acyl-CoA thioester hydrolase